MARRIEYARNMRGDMLCESTEERLVFRSERVAHMTVDVDLGDEAALPEDRHDDLRLRLNAATQIVLGGRDVGHDMGIEALGALPTDSATIRDLGVFRRFAAERTEYENPLFRDRKVEARPIVVRDLLTEQITDKLQTLTRLFRRRQ